MSSLPHAGPPARARKKVPEPGRADRLPPDVPVPEPAVVPSVAPEAAAEAGADALEREITELRFEVHEVPLADPLVLWDALPDEPAAYWRAPGTQGDTFSGAGIALSFEARGDGRFFAIAEAAREALAASAGALPAPLRLVGGLAFDPAGGHSPQWRDFGPARFFLPRYTYFPGTRSARLVVALRPEDGAQTLAATERVLDALKQNAPATPLGLWPVRVERLPRETWSEWIGRVQSAISSGVVSKVVLARESILDLPVPVSARAVLSRLSAEHEDCFCFGLRFGAAGKQAAFVGASPERLLRLDGRQVKVDALAGTAGLPARDAGSGALERSLESLRSSLKDRDEHRYVVEAITAALSPLCTSLEVEETPTVRRLRHVLHLHTSIEGQLGQKAHLLEVASALHPTPAVAGTPTKEARAILGACEQRDRGWYAGPIGWFDAEGSGELCVGLRSGLLQGHEAHLFAGAGVVAGSRADAEYEETRLKERALCQALGVRP